MSPWLEVGLGLLAGLALLAAILALSLLPLLRPGRLPLPSGQNHDVGQPGNEG